MIDVAVGITTEIACVAVQPVAEHVNRLRILAKQFPRIQLVQAAVPAIHVLASDVSILTFHRRGGRRTEGR